MAELAWEYCFVGVKHNKITFACVDDHKENTGEDVVEALRRGATIHYVEIKHNRPIIIGAQWEDK